MRNKKIISLLLLLWCCHLPVLTACKTEDRADTPSGEPEHPEVINEVTAYITTSNRSYDLSKKQIPLSGKVSMSPTTVTIDPTTIYQEMDGFGAAITGATCYNLSLMTPANRTSFLKETFSPTEGYGFSYIRISIGCSDFSLNEYTCCDKAGIENFSITGEETNYIIPILKEILAINPSIKILGSPWTCPKWMKVNNLTEKKPYDSWTSGQLNPAYYPDYATYFVKWIKAFEAEGISIYSITPQNEPLNRGNSASLYMSWEEERDFIKTALGPQLKAAGLATKIYAFDHNYNYDNIASQQGYPLNIYADNDASQYVTGAAYHNYGGNRNELNNIHKQAPAKELLFTETSIGTWNSGRDLGKRLLADMKEVALGTVNNWCRGVIVWNLMLDNDRAPNRPGGCQTCYGAVDIDNSSYSHITRNSHYYIISHLSAVVKPGARRIGTTGYSETDVTYSAFKNPDGSYAFVIVNDNPTEKSFNVNEGKTSFTYKLPGYSITSFQWKNSVY